MHLPNDPLYSAPEQGHPLKPGDQVTVYRGDFVEGHGCILCPFGDEPHLYLVLFDDEALPQLRVVRPEQQADPAQVVLQLSAPYGTAKAATAPRILPFAMLRFLRPNSSET